jgi:hypothetical protein
MSTNERLKATMIYDTETCEFKQSMLGIDSGPPKWTYSYDFPLPEYFIYNYSENIIAPATYEGFYYYGVHSVKGAGHFSLSLEYDDVLSDDDNTPSEGTNISDVTNNNLEHYGSVDMFKDRFDWYKGQFSEYGNLTVNLSLEIGPQDGVFGMTIYHLNETGEIINEDEAINIFNNQLIDSFDIDIEISSENLEYFIVVRSIVPLHPSNKAQLQSSSINSILNYTITFFYSNERNVQNDEVQGPCKNLLALISQ